MLEVEQLRDEALGEVVGKEQRLMRVTRKTPCDVPASHIRRIILDGHHFDHAGRHDAEADEQRKDPEECGRVGALPAN